MSGWVGGWVRERERERERGRLTSLSGSKTNSSQMFTNENEDTEGSIFNKNNLLSNLKTKMIWIVHASERKKELKY